MPDIGDDGDVDEHERFAAVGDAVKNAWMRTIEDLEALADERRDEGWDVVTIPAGDTTAVSRDAGDDDQFGIVHVIADNQAEEFTGAFERGEFRRFEAYRNEVEGFVFLVTELLDPETETAILLAGQYELRNAAGMVAAAKDEGALYTHVRTLDGTMLGSVRHDEIEPLVPGADRIDEWTQTQRQPGRSEE